MHNRRALLFFAFAVVFGTAAAFLAHRALEDQTPTTAASAPAVETVNVVLARTDVTTGSALTAQQLRTVEWPKEYAPTGSFSDEDEVVGRVLRRALADGEPILEPSLLVVGAEAGLVSVINDKTRAVSVKVDPIIGVAGFVNPGTRVDVVATLRRVDTAKKIPVTKVVLQDVRVLAVDQKLEEARDGDPEVVNVVTVEVDPSEAEHLIYAAHEGKLQLALRTPGDDDLVETKSVGVADLLGGKPAGTRKPTQIARRSTSVEIIRGAKVETKTF